MDIYGMEKMLELGRFAEKIAAGVVDDQAYNALTQTLNEDVIDEARNEVETILENGGKINGEINLEKLAKEVSEALNLPKTVKLRLRVNVNAEIINP